MKNMSVLLRFEPYNVLQLTNEEGALYFRAGELICTRRHRKVKGHVAYGGMDWVAVAVTAPEDADLTDPKSWKMTEKFVGNPLSSMNAKFKIAFGIDYRVDEKAQMSIWDSRLRGNRQPIFSEDVARAYAIGSLYGMEGVPVRRQDTRRMDNKVISIMRINNNKVCDLAAMVEFDDSGSERFVGSYAGDYPGESWTSEYSFRQKSDLYWMISHAARDSYSNWSPSHLQVNTFTSCEADRSTFALYFSSNALDWQFALMIGLHKDFDGHFAYPHMIIHEDTLFVMSRATIFPTNVSVNLFYNNHNSNAIILHKLHNFRDYAFKDWTFHSKFRNYSSTTDS